MRTDKIKVEVCCKQNAHILRAVSLTDSWVDAVLWEGNAIHYSVSKIVSAGAPLTHSDKPFKSFME